MADGNFFRNSARECRHLARRARTDAVRRELLLWAKAFDAMADERGTPAIPIHELETVV
jgi:hypothetical protein